LWDGERDESLRRIRVGSVSADFRSCTNALTAEKPQLSAIGHQQGRQHPC
jgi:hypothetical protein